MHLFVNKYSENSDFSFVLTQMLQNIYKMFQISGKPRGSPKR